MFTVEKPWVAVLFAMSTFAPALLSLLSGLRRDSGAKRISVGVSLLGVGLLVAAVVAAFLSAMDAGLLPGEIVRAWILPGSSDHELTVGMLVDTAGFSVVIYSAFVFAIFLLAQFRTDGAHRSLGRTLVAAGFSLSGIALAWLSVSYWLSLAGQVVAGMGSAVFIAATPPLPGADESSEVGNYLIERAAVLLFGVLGGCALLVSGHAPSWNAMSAVEESGSEIRSGLLALGEVLVLISCSFSLLSPVRTFASVRSRVKYSGIGIAAAIVGPAVATLAPVIRLQPLLAENAGVLGLFGAIAAIAMILVALHSAVLENASRMILPVATAGSLVPFIALCTGGVGICMPILLGWIAAVSTWGVLSERLEGMAGTAGDGVRKVLLVVPALVLVGFPGFTTAGTLGGWLTFLVSQVSPHLSILTLMALAAFGVQLWFFVASAWSETRSSQAQPLGAADLIISAVILLPAIGLAWTGTISGELIDGGADRVLGSLGAGVIAGTRLWEKLSAGNGAAGAELQVSGIAVASWLIVQTVLAGAAFWFEGAGERSRRAAFLKNFPRTRDFFLNGMAIPVLAVRVGRGLRKSGLAIHEGVTHVFWFKFVSALLGKASAAVSVAAARADRFMIAITTRAIRSGADGASGGLRRIQSGDVQWYVLFGVGGGLLVLLTFFRLAKF